LKIISNGVGRGDTAIDHAGEKGILEDVIDNQGKNIQV